MKKIAYALVLSLGVVSVYAEDSFVPAVTPEQADVAVVAEDDAALRTILTEEEHTGAIAWMKEHKALTISIASVLAVAIAAGVTLKFSEKARTWTTEKYTAAKDRVVNAGKWVGDKAKGGATYYWDHKKWTVPTTVISLIVIGLTTYDLCQDADESFIKTFVNKLIGKEEAVA